MYRVPKSLLRKAAAFLTLLVLTATAASALPRAKQRWVELDTSSFHFFSNANSRVTLRIAGDLEQLRAVLDELSSLELSSPRPTVIYVFKSDSSFQPYSMLRDGKPDELSGYFVPRQHANYIAINGGSGWDTSDIVYRAYVHHVVNDNFPGLPLWLDEGLAELYSTFRMAGEAAHIGLVVPQHLRWLRSGAPIPLDQLLAADRDSALYNENRCAFSAQAWILAHYLLVANEQRRGQCLRYMELVGKMPRDEAFRQAFATDHATLQKELRTYVRRHIFRFLKVPVSKRASVLTEPRPMAYADVLYRLGDLLANNDPTRHEEAADHFRAVLAARADHGAALAGLGYLAQRQEQWQEAAGHYARAAELAPGDSLIQYRYGAALVRRGGEGDAAQAVAALRRSVERDPEFAPAWAWLTHAYTCVTEPPGEAALLAGETALELLPSRVDVALNLFELYARAGRREAAGQLFDDYLAARADLVDRARARTRLAGMDFERAFRMVAEGRLDEAEELTDRVAAQTAYAGIQAYVDPHVRQLHRVIEDRRFEDRFGEVIAQVSSGEAEAAVTILEQLIEQGLADRHGRRARSLLDQIGEQRQRDVAQQARARRRADSDTAQSADRERVAGLLARNRPAEALEVLERMSRRSSSVNLRRWIGSTMQQAHGLIEHNRFLERYNEAVDWFNDREYAAAVKILAQLVATMPEDRAVGEARELLEEAKAEMKRQG